MSTFFLKIIVAFILFGLQLEDADAGIGSCKLSSLLIHTSGTIWIDFHFVFMDSIQRYGYVEIGIYRIVALSVCPFCQLIRCSFCPWILGFYLDLIRSCSGDACRNTVCLVLYRTTIGELKIICIGKMSFPNQSGRTIYLDVVGCS